MVTVCPRRSDPFYLVSYNIKWITTSWTYSIIFKYFHPSTLCVVRRRCWLIFQTQNAGEPRRYQLQDRLIDIILSIPLAIILTFYLEITFDLSKKFGSNLNDYYIIEIKFFKFLWLEYVILLRSLNIKWKIIEEN